MELTEGTAVTPSIRLVRPLAQGGMGSVWVARHEALDIEIAVKFIGESALARDAKLGERFTREARVSARIRDPHVVHVLDHGTTADGTPFIAMELLEGVSLATELERGPLSLEASVALVRQTAGALAKAHGLGIVHRDVKPDNLFLTTTAGSVFVKILDFGIAMHHEADSVRVTSTGATFGTPLYMSPEQLLSTRDVDARANLWALAAVAYEALTGKAPFAGATIPALTLAICKSDFVPPHDVDPKLPPALDGFFARAFARDLEARFASAGELAEGFAAACMVPAEPSAPESLPFRPTVPHEPAAAGAATTARALPLGANTIGAASTTLRLQRGDKRRRAVQPWVWGGVLGVALLVVLVWGLQRNDGAPASAVQQSSAANSARAGDERAEASARPLPSALQDAASAPFGPAASVAPSVASATSATASASSSATAMRPRAGASGSALPSTAVIPVAPPSASVTPRVDCSNPFFVDADGIKHVRKECP